MGPVVRHVLVAVKVLAAVNARQHVAVATLALIMVENLVLLQALTACAACEGHLGDMSRRVWARGAMRKPCVSESASFLFNHTGINQSINQSDGNLLNRIVFAIYKS